MVLKRLLQLATLDGAVDLGIADRTGSITPGKLADITVLSRNLLTVPDDELLDTEIVMTIIGGRIRYRDGEIIPAD